MVELQNVVKSFGSVKAVRGVSLKVNRGEFITLLGPSGCGKTTTLRMIGGFEEPDEGDVILDGKSVKGKRPFERDTNTVFQSYALFPHMTVAQNVAFGLKMKGIDRKERNKKVEEALALVRMEAFAKRHPKQLSGGEQQRVAVARAIVNNPRVLLLDEPLGSLDLKLRKQMQVDLKQLQKRVGITFIYVTHDQEEALTMSDRVAIMHQGTLEQVDTPLNVYRQPKTRFVADFIGETTLLPCTVMGMSGGFLSLDCHGTGVKAPIPQGVELAPKDQVHLSIRPEDLTVTYTKTDEPNVFQGTLQEVIFIGHTAKVIVDLDMGARIVAHIPTTMVTSLKKDLHVSWKPEDSVVVTE